MYKLCFEAACVSTSAPLYKQQDTEVFMPEDRPSGHVMYPIQVYTSQKHMKKNKITCIQIKVNEDTALRRTGGGGKDGIIT